MPDTEDTPLGLPMQPTGSGVADLETEREAEAVVQGDAVEQPADDEEPDEAEAAAQLGELS